MSHTRYTCHTLATHVTHSLHMSHTRYTCHTLATHVVDTPSVGGPNMSSTCVHAHSLHVVDTPSVGGPNMLLHTCQRHMSMLTCVHGHWLDVVDTLSLASSTCDDMSSSLVRGNSTRSAAMLCHHDLCSCYLVSYSQSVILSEFVSSRRRSLCLSLPLV